MKTFDEALKLSVVFVTAPTAATCDEKTAEVEAQMAEGQERYRELRNEAAENHEVNMLISFLIKAVSEGQIDPETAIFTAFMSGLTTGIEMEKAE